jgi:hypothetical protein
VIHTIVLFLLVVRNFKSFDASLSEDSATYIPNCNTTTMDSSCECCRLLGGLASSSSFERPVSAPPIVVTASSLRR